MPNGACARGAAPSKQFAGSGLRNSAFAEEATTDGKWNQGETQQRIRGVKRHTKRIERRAHQEQGQKVVYV